MKGLKRERTGGRRPRKRRKKQRERRSAREDDEDIKWGFRIKIAPSTGAHAGRSFLFF